MSWLSFLNSQSGQRRMSTDKGCAPGKSSLIGLGSARDYDGCAILHYINQMWIGQFVTSSNIIQQWQTRWVSDPRSQHHKTIEKLVSTKSKFQCASRRKEILISKLRIGKCALNQHLFLLKHHPDGKCQVCPQEDENVRHFLMECPAQSVLREEIRTRTNLSEMSTMLSNPASVDLIFRWICKNRINLI